MHQILIEQTFQHASQLHAAGQLQDAERLYDQILEADQGHFATVYGLGIIRLQQSRFGEAEVLFRKAVEIDLTSADAQHHLAISLTGSGRLPEALLYYEKALSLNPRSAEIHNNFGYALQQLARHAEAAAHYQKALAIAPHYAEAMNNLGNAFRALDRYEEALRQYQSAVAARPGYVEAESNLGSTLAALGRYEEAIAQCQLALSLGPGFPPALMSLGEALEGAGRYEDALSAYQKALIGDPSQIDNHVRLGRVYFMLGRPEEAIEQYRQLLATKPDHVEAMNNLGAALLALGRFDQAAEALETAVALAPWLATPYLHIVNSRPVASAEDPFFIEMQELQRDESLPEDEQSKLHFALGKAHADLGNFDLSFQQLQQGNLLHREMCGYDEPKTMEQFARVKAVFSANLLREKGGLGDPSPVPIFIVGMPRSGMALVEQILASVPNVFGAGDSGQLRKVALGVEGANNSEFPEIFAALPNERWRALGTKYLQAIRRAAPNAERITDRSAGTFLLAGLIAMVLPNARIIHVHRDARDLAASCFSTLFTRGHDYTYDLGELARYIRAYEDLMAHWREALPAGLMIDVQYEAVVENFQPEVRRILSHCGLEWNDACLDFHKTERLVRSETPAQVRQPIYRSALGRWRHYGDHLQPLLDALKLTEPPVGSGEAISCR